MPEAQVAINETPPMSEGDLQTLAKNETDENGLILGKFKSVEDLAASYKELEGKLGTQPQEETPTEETTTEETETPEFNANEYYGEGLAEVLTEAQIDPQDISNRFEESGEISEDDYTKLEGAGFSRQVIDTYLDGLRGGTGDSSEIATAQIQGIKDAVGGDDSYSKMTAWAIDNLPAGDVDAFNKLTETGDAPSIKLAVQGLYSQYSSAMGVEPNLVTGKAATSGPTPYKSTAEVVTAMKDPRYGKDVTYTEDVQRRLGDSDVFTTR
tara:strand:- start:259 stop:1062 length:804 start_codon:yes stop_codon:yes gene_type:complete